MKQFKIILTLTLVLLTFSLSKVAAQENWQLSLTSDYHIPYNANLNAWEDALGYEHGSLTSRKKQKASTTLMADYHFFTQKPVGFFLGTGFGYRKYENFRESIASGRNAFVFSTSNIAIPWRLGLDIRPNDRFTINLSTTYELLPAVHNGSRGSGISAASLSDEEYFLGEIPDNVTRVDYSVYKRGGVMVSLDLGIDIEIYKNYALFFGAGIGSLSYEYETSEIVTYTSPVTSEPTTDNRSRIEGFPDFISYNFINLKAGITKTF